MNNMRNGGVAVQLLTGQQLIFLAVQVTYALQYLHQQSIHHKDVAARNCTWDSNDANSRRDWQQYRRHGSVVELEASALFPFNVWFKFYTINRACADFWLETRARKCV